MSTKRKPLSKKKYGRLLVINDGPSVCSITNKGRKIYRRKVECLCDCGKTVFIDAQHLWRGNTTSCGCWNSNVTIIRSTKHGGCGSPEYAAWRGMKDRCSNPKNIGFHCYGGRGIKVSDSWNDSFDAFYNDMGARPSKNHSLERKDNEKGYSKENCIWATQKEQQRNKRTTYRVLYNGKNVPLLDIAEATKLSYRFLYDRLRAGWTIYEAIKHPKNAKLTSIR